MTTAEMLITKSTIQTSLRSAARLAQKVRDLGTLLLSVVRTEPDEAPPAAANPRNPSIFSDKE